MPPHKRATRCVTTRADLPSRKQNDCCFPNQSRTGRSSGKGGPAGRQLITQLSHPPYSGGRTPSSQLLSSSFPLNGVPPPLDTFTASRGHYILGFLCARCITVMTPSREPICLFPLSLHPVHLLNTSPHGESQAPLTHCLHLQSWSISAETHAHSSRAPLKLPGLRPPQMDP